MKDGLLTDRQKEILRYRRNGMTQQQVADVIHTSKANVCTLEKSAMENIERAKKTLYFYHTLNGRHICTLMAGSDLFDSVNLVFEEAKKTGIAVNADWMTVTNRLRDELPKRIHGRFIREDIDVFLGNDGDLAFG